MNKKIFIDYDLAIADALRDINVWLAARQPRDSTEVKEIAETKAMWKDVMSNPREYVQYSKLYDYVCNHAKGFIIRLSANTSNNAMYLGVINLLSEMNFYYDSGDNKMKLAKAIKNIKTLCAKNSFQRFKISLFSPERLIAQKQK